MRKIVLLPLLFFNTLAFSQIDKKFPQPDPDFKKYLNDGRMELAKNALKIHLDGIINHEILATYERKFSGLFSIETGGGFFIKYPGFYESEMLYSREVIDSVRLPKKSGFTLQIMPKLYFGKQGIDNGIYYGFLFKQRYLQNWYKQEIRYTEYAFMMGVQTLAKKKLCINYGWGLGFGKSKVLDKDIEDFPYIFPTFHLRLAVGLFMGKNYFNSDSENQLKKKGEEINEDDE
ncbi:MAG: hypothetical protein HUU47_01775 [Bacteroidetes bacterium]|nr:hypothetical protein [Bacteroidota bacterium]